jgi:methylene-fatty-acyl-phospholipid synthase
MLWIALAVAAMLLALERLTYAAIWFVPDRFERLCRQWPLNRLSTPVDAMQALFYFFKAIQLGVFIAWCSLFSGQIPPLPTAGPAALTVGLALIVAGQVLNASVFWRLGKTGVFYGNKLGHTVQWVEGFPFSVIPHPQYVGTAMSIWGFFVVMRFPNPDWIALPLLQTVYYVVGARLER